MAYLIDTDIYIYLTAGNQKIRDKIREAGDENIYLSSITVAELYFGAYNSTRRDDNLYKIQKNIEKIQILNFNRHAAKMFGRFKSDLKRKGTPMADLDLAIASISLSNQHVLVTHNKRHFSVIEELLIEDWLL